jgi:hypothetical protein
MKARDKIDNESAVKRRAQSLWARQAQSMLAAFERTGNVQNLRAARRHVDAILRRLSNEREGCK